ncbi:hypothetical protein SASPL_136635 [Salvia splendens]|uniref:Glycosyltransferase n=1 Tax=Salvia splendens TaxID=180675 RepID=A0A8X8X190_SALSN|nr:hypothetical protein SASPL_136635 [Salvia splendens]
MPVQGHLNSMLNLSHLFCLAEFDVTFIISDFSHRRLLQHTTVAATFARYPGFQFLAFPDGLPEDHPRSGHRAMEFMSSVNNVTVPLFKEMMIQENFLASATRRPVTCFVADGKSMDELIESIPGMEGFIRRRDLPSFYRVDDLNDPVLKDIVAVTMLIKRARVAIFNTCEDLEGQIVAEVRKHVPRVFSIGPIHEQVKYRLTEKKAESSIITASLWAEDRSCIDWLDAQPSKSVIYVSFGSLALVTTEQVLEVLHGLLDSSQRFLWVMRPDSITAGNDGEDPVLVELKELVKGKGLLVAWAPQEKVLNHPAVGGFMTHSGWNSTLESIAAGVPMVCWPYFGDQTTNSRFVSEVWRIGLDIKDTCDRKIIEKAIRDLMEVRKDEFMESSANLAKLVKNTVSKGGLSYDNLDGLTQYIKSLVI